MMEIDADLLALSNAVRMANAGDLEGAARLAGPASRRLRDEMPSLDGDSLDVVRGLISRLHRLINPGDFD